MTIVAELLAKPGVIAAGEYTYKADISAYKGPISEHHARMLAVMCHATTKAATMEGEMLKALNPRIRIDPARGWILRGPERTLCVMADVFCVIDNAQASLNKILGDMSQALADEDMDAV